MSELVERWERWLEHHSAGTMSMELPKLVLQRMKDDATQLAEARESERAAMTEVNGLKDALAQVPEFICRKCGQRQDGPTDNEARF